LLELERDDLEKQWRSDHPDGEVVVVPPLPERILHEVLSPSLFAPCRLLVVRDASVLLTAGKGGEGSTAVAGGLRPRSGTRARETGEGAPGEKLAVGLHAAPWQGVTLLLAAQITAVPKGALARLAQDRGEVRFLPIPDPPKPWEQVAVTAPQRLVLTGLLRRVAPELSSRDDVVDALCEHYGFRPRELAQAAQRLVLAGTLSAEEVRIQAGAGEVALSELEDALIARDGGLAVRFVARLGAGGILRLFGDRLVDPDGIGPVVAGSLARLLRQALATRRYARQAGLGGDLDPGRCREGRWYGQRFKEGVFPRLKQAAAQAPGSPLASVNSPWAAHRIFRIAAAYDDRELLRALASLGRVVAERESSAAAALAALTPSLLELIRRRPARSGRRVGDG
jgi:hypothetical protein